MAKSLISQNKPQDIPFSLFSIGLFSAPFFPFLQYWNGAYWAVSFLLLGFVVWTVLGRKIFRKKDFNWVDLGFGLLFIVTLAGLLKSVYVYGSLPSKTQSLNFILLCFSFFYGAICFKYANINWQKWVFLPFTYLVIISAYVLWKANQVGFSYAALTSALSYNEGLGNISQIAMYLSFYGILIFFISKRIWLLSISTMLVIVSAYLLDSKMLALVLFFCCLAKLMERVAVKRQLQGVFAGLLIGSISILILQPSFLSGRFQLWGALLSSFGFENVAGIGLGNFSTYINQVFLNGLATNTIGELYQLCFNDFIQVFLELGVLGFVGLIMIFFGLVHQKTIGYLMALGLVLFFMFPLQYIESAVLFAFTTLVFYQHTNKPKWTINMDASTQRALVGVLAVCCFAYVGIQQLRHNKWYKADEETISENMDSGLSYYQAASSEFAADDLFFLRYGLHLKKNGNYNEALRMLNWANQLNPSYHSFIYLGDCYFDMGFEQEAIGKYERAQTIWPQHLYPVYKTIYAYNNLDQFENAEDYWDKNKEAYTKLFSPTMQTMYTEIEELLSMQ